MSAENISIQSFIHSTTFVLAPGDKAVNKDEGPCPHGDEC